MTTSNRIRCTSDSSDIYTLLLLLQWPINWLTCHSYAPSQADVVTFKAVPKEPAVEKFPHAYRWYNHIKSYESEFASLPGDPSKAFTTYGPEKMEVTQNPKDAPEDDDDVDLFGSDDEEEDPEVVAERERRLADYKKKKEGKAKPAAKSMVTMDVKPWDGLFFPLLITLLLPLNLGISY